MNLPKLDIMPEHQEFIDLIYRLAHAYPENPRCSFEDYVSVGMAALECARQSFDEGREIKFSTYTYPFIKNAIEKEFQNNVNALSGATPYHFNNTEGAKEEIQFINNTSISLSANRRDLDESPYIKHIDWQQPRYKRPTLKEVIIESGAFNPERRAEQIEISNALSAAMGQLEEEERDIIFRRLFNEDTFQDIAEATNLSWRAVNYRFHKSLEKMKELLIEAGMDIYA